MSKQRPSDFPTHDAEQARQATRSKTDVGYWEARLFRNTFTRDGKLVRVKGWSVKIQHQGRRRSFALGAIRRADAAVKACRLYRQIVTRGWVVGPRQGPEGRHRLALAGSGARARLEPRYWKRRLIRRQYTGGLRPHVAGELSARVEDKGTSHYFPLGSADAKDAAAQAAEIYRTVVTRGWGRARQAFPREITVAVLWSLNPLACTYTTLYTGFGPQASISPARSDRGQAGLPVIVVDPEAAVRQAMAMCVDRQPGFRCVAAVATVDELLGLGRRSEPAPLLLTRHSVETPRHPPDPPPHRPGGGGFRSAPRFLHGLSLEPRPGEALEERRRRAPDLSVIPYGVYADSDQLFLAFGGVSGGYMLQRRPPTGLLDPIRAAPARRSLAARPLGLQVRLYFQRLFDAARPDEAPPEPAPLTSREQEILEHVSKGYVDKEIAERLGLSAWTVHSHLKRIYQKLGVHSRTEAALRYLGR